MEEQTDINKVFFRHIHQNKEFSTFLDLFTEEVGQGARVVLICDPYMDELIQVNYQLQLMLPKIYKNLENTYSSYSGSCSDGFWIGLDRIHRERFTSLQNLLATLPVTKLGTNCTGKFLIEPFPIGIYFSKASPIQEHMTATSRNDMHIHSQ